jgi:hypothetical protein
MKEHPELLPPHNADQRETVGMREERLAQKEKELQELLVQTQNQQRLLLDMMKTMQEMVKGGQGGWGRGTPATSEQGAGSHCNTAVTRGYSQHPPRGTGVS